MIRRALDLSGVAPMSRRQIESLAELAAGFSSRILIEHRNRVINGKSMLGLLSLGDTGREPAALICDGEDEEAAARAIVALVERGMQPPQTAADALVLMQQVKERFSAILGDSLRGLYLHGSLAAGCFCWARSDVDFLAVVTKPPREAQKIALINALVSMEESAPPAGFEMSVILEKYCRDIPFPIPFELHYSLRHRAAFLADPGAFCRDMQGADPDLTTHILSLHAHGRAILGPDIPRMFDRVKRRDALAAMRLDLAGAESGMNERPVYYVLTLCRALAYGRTGLALSKKDGGEWALRHLPTEYQPLIQAALNAYESGLDMTYNESQAADFCADALEEIMQKTKEE